MLYALMMLHFACESPRDLIDDTRSIPDFHQVSDGLYHVFSGALKMTGSLSMIEILERSDKRIVARIEAKIIANASQDYFNQQFKTGIDLESLPYLVPYPVNGLEPDQAGHMVNRMIDSSAAFNLPQKEYIKWLTRDIAKVQDLDQGLQLVTEFRSQITNSAELGDEDKLILLEIAAGSHALLKFFKEGGVEEIQKGFPGIVLAKTGNGKAAKCQVEWRKIWISGVVSFTAGAISGAIAGATVGTVTLPLFGTATGAVGGAVFGGAAGFSSGVIYGIASDLIASCSRPGEPRFQQTYRSCEKAWQAYVLNQTKKIPNGCLVVEVLI